MKRLIALVLGLGLMFATMPVRATPWNCGATVQIGGGWQGVTIEHVDGTFESLNDGLEHVCHDNEFVTANYGQCSVQPKPWVMIRVYRNTNGISILVCQHTWYLDGGCSWANVRTMVDCETDGDNNGCDLATAGEYCPCLD